MRILLPPSEAKRSGGHGPPMTFGDDVLGEARRRAAVELSRFAGEPGAAATLALPARSAAAELAANRCVIDAPTMPGLLRYAGVVYDGLDAARLAPGARRRADEAVLIFSGLWGVVGAGERVPNYRLPTAAALPGLGVMSAFWRPVLDAVLPALLGDGLVIDLRSSDYAAMWRPPREQRGQVLSVRVLSAQAGRPPAVISYPSKLAKGRLARALVTRRGSISRPGQIVDVWRRIGGAGGELTDRGVDLLV